MINNTIPLGISPKAWRGEASRQKLLCQMEERFPGNSFYRLLLDCPAFEIITFLEEVERLLHQPFSVWPIRPLRQGKPQATAIPAPGSRRGSLLR